MKVFLLVILLGLPIITLAWAWKLRHYKGGGMILPKDYSERVIAEFIDELVKLEKGKSNE